MKKFIFIHLIMTALMVGLVSSCGWGGSKGGSRSPFSKKELKDTTMVVRGEGSATSVDAQMAEQEAYMNAMVVIAGKLSEAEKEVSVDENGGVREKTSVSTPVMNASIVDKRVYHNEKSNTYTVWVLVEAKREQ